MGGEQSGQTMATINKKSILSPNTGEEERRDKTQKVPCKTKLHVANCKGPFDGEDAMEYVRRHLEGELREAFGWTKAILLVGARQVGKTTLLRHVFPGLRMVTFDPARDTMGARENPELFLETLKGPAILDEAQYAPELFPALKRRMDADGETGQYVLSGSQNPLLLKQVSESLAGRVAVFEMEGYSVAERTGRGGGGMPWLARFLANGGRWEGAMPEEGKAREGLMEVLWRGGLPEVARMPERFARRYMAS